MDKRYEIVLEVRELGWVQGPKHRAEQSPSDTCEWGSEAFLWSWVLVSQTLFLCLFDGSERGGIRGFETGRRSGSRDETLVSVGAATTSKT